MERISVINSIIEYLEKNLIEMEKEILQIKKRIKGFKLAMINNNDLKIYFEDNDNLKKIKGE